jgi:aspartate/methionine/tyrosine aminotransferase
VFFDDDFVVVFLPGDRLLLFLDFIFYFLFFPPSRFREYAFDTPAVSLLSYMQAMPDQILILDSLSKRYSLCGARLGMLITKNKKIMAGVTREAWEA